MYICRDGWFERAEELGTEYHNENVVYIPETDDESKAAREYLGAMNSKQKNTIIGRKISFTATQETIDARESCDDMLLWPSRN